MEAFYFTVCGAILLFSIWYVIRQIGYWGTTEILFHDMIQNQENIVKLLVDIRDNTKTFKNPLPEFIECPHCGKQQKLSLSERQTRKFNCIKCKKEIVM